MNHENHLNLRSAGSLISLLAVFFARWLSVQQTASRNHASACCNRNRNCGGGNHTGAGRSRAGGNHRRTGCGSSGGDSGASHDQRDGFGGKNHSY